MKKLTNLIGNDLLAAALAGLGGAGLYCLYLFAGLEAEQAAEVKGIAKSMLTFMLFAGGRHKHEKGKQAVSDGSE